MSLSPLYRSTANIARKHSRMSVIAAAAATAGALGAAGFATGAAPWEQTVGNVATTAHVDSSSASGQPGSSPLFKAIAGIKTAHAGTPAASGQLDVFRSAGPAGSTSPNATGDQAIVTFAAEEANVQAAKQQAAQQAAKAKAAAQAKVAAAAKLKAAAQAKAAARSKAFAQAKAAAAVKAKAVAAAKARAKAAAKPYIMYDSVTPSSIPSGKAAAVYANGAYAASSAQTAGHGSVLWIDTNGSDPAANVLDVEPGDATPAGAAQWVKQRLTHQPKSVAIVYTMKSDWQQVKDNVAALPGWMQSKVRYWIADPTGTPHVVPGSSATQWYWGNSYDVTTANPNFVG
jgi:hypothetical protein